MDLIETANSLFGYTQNLRRDFHRHPELGFQEQRTSRLIFDELTKMGIETRTTIAETGISALLIGKKTGPVILYRSDIDALPIMEDSISEYTSENPGVMHACGHDGHIAIALTVAKILSERRENLNGSVKFVFQPAEELLTGANRMVDEGVLRDPVPDISLALHLWNEKPIGWFGISPGPVSAAGSVFNVKIKGKGGHGAIPNLSHDPVIASAHIISILQTIISRNLNPLESGVISVTSIHAGNSFNVIPDELEFQGTIRAHQLDVILLIENRLNEIAVDIANTFGCAANVTIHRLTEPVVNDLMLTKRIHKTTHKFFPQADIDNHYQTMASEDFAYLHKNNPGCYIFVGSNNSVDRMYAPHHDSHFNFDEQVLPLSVALMATVIIDLLENNRS